jgi:xylan 1,4-beta-xylosidase
MPYGNVYIQEADLSGIEKNDLKLVGERKMIASRDNSDVGKKTSPEYLEGPWMLRRQHKYVLLTAAPYNRRKRAGENASPPDLADGYWVGAAVADTVWGPYKKEPQVFLGGHVAVFTGPDGKDWYSYRGESVGKAHGRLCIDPVQFNEDGSVRPSVPSNGPVTVE